MAYLVFSSPEQLRLALIAGLVPADWQRQAVWAAVEPGDNRIWIDWPDPRSQSFIDCQRFAVAYLNPPVELQFQQRLCWAELIPCCFEKPSVEFPGSRWLLELPTQDLARSVKQLLVGIYEPVSMMILGTSEKLATALLLVNQPLATAERVGDFHGQLYRECVTNVWMPRGWAHPLAMTLKPPAGEGWLIAPEQAWRTIPCDRFRQPPQSLAFEAQPPRLIAEPSTEARRQPARLPVPLKLARHSTASRDEQLWIFSGVEQQLRLRDFAENSQGWLSSFQAARIRHPQGEERLLIRIATGGVKRRVPRPAGVAGWTCLPGVPELFVPSGYQLLPRLNAAFLRKCLKLSVDEVAWIELGDGEEWRLQRCSAAAFQPLAEFLEYQSPGVKLLSPWTADVGLFSLPGVTVEPEQLSAVEPLAMASRPGESERARLHPLRTTRQWLTKSWQRLWVRSRLSREAVSPSSEMVPEAFPPIRAGSDDGLTRVVTVGRDWAARRESLEQVVVSSLQECSRAERAQLWAELAQVYMATGQWTEAALCWTHCGWNDLDNRYAWAEGWWRSELQLAKLPESASFPEAILSGLSPVIAARLAAAYLVVSDAREQFDVSRNLPLKSLQWLVERYESDLPTPIVWLATRALEHWTGSDPLTLARCRDRLFARLGQSGLALDLDVPAFLRFYGGTRPERFVAARDWLVRIREPVHRWLQRLGITASIPQSSHPLAWSGLEPERAATVAYADLMLAWGLSQLGDRTRARQLDGPAQAILENLEHRSSEDAIVHGYLRQRFDQTIRAAQAGHFNRIGIGSLPPLREFPWPGDPFCQYVIRQFLCNSRILDPQGFIEPFQGRDLIPLLSQDPLGRRLARLMQQASPWRGEEAATLLAVAAADPGPATLPRLLLVLFERHTEFDEGLAASAWGWLCSAMRDCFAWCRSVDPGAGSADLTAMMLRRLITDACRIARRFHWSDRLAEWLDQLPRLFNDSTEGELLRAAVLASSQELFQTMHRLGVQQPARKLLPWLKMPVGEVEPIHLGLAIGWFLIGHDDEANALVDRARDRLFVRGVKSLETRTALAQAYATVLGYAPARVALGRYEELFLRLSAIETRSSTNRFFTRQPLALIDTVIRSVVSEEFNLSPEARAWLDIEEFRIRQRISQDLQATLLRVNQQRVARSFPEAYGRGADRVVEAHPLISNSS